MSSKNYPTWSALRSRKTFQDAGNKHEIKMIATKWKIKIVSQLFFVALQFNDFSHLRMTTNYNSPRNFKTHTLNCRRTFEGPSFACKFSLVQD